MDNRSILFLDSGIGGLPYVGAVADLCPDLRPVYIADTANFPYGTRTAAQIRDVVIDLVDRAVGAFEPGLVVVACNTASVVALEDLRSRFSVPFVGVVPAVKPAAAAARTGGIGILSTDRTADARYLADLVEDFAAGTPVTVRPAGALVSFVEHRLGAADDAERLEAVRHALEGLDTAGLDAVVLGCTHFTHLAGEIDRVVGGETRVVDSRDGVARRVAELSGDCRAPGAGSQPPGAGAAGSFYVTGSEDDQAAARYAAVSARWGLSYEGRFA